MEKIEFWTPKLFWGAKYAKWKKNAKKNEKKLSFWGVYFQYYTRLK